MLTTIHASFCIYNTCMDNWLLTGRKDNAGLLSTPSSANVHILASSVSRMKESVILSLILSPFGLTTVTTLPLHRNCSLMRYVSFLSTSVWFTSATTFTCSPSRESLLADIQVSIVQSADTYGNCYVVKFYVMICHDIVSALQV